MWLTMQESTQDEPTLTKRLEAAKGSMLQIVQGLAAVQIECGLDLDPESYAKLLNFKLMEVE